MSDLMKYGIAVAPNNVVNTLLTGWMNAWFVNVKDPKYRLRDRMVGLHNTVDSALGEYTEQLKGELSKLRKSIPQPTRENPYPPLDGLEAVKDLEQYIRHVEAIRTKVLSASVPPDEYVFHGSSQNERLLSDLLAVDGELVSAMQTMTPETIDVIDDILRRRELLLRSFVTD
ncbi:hypothetical protein [Alicyclobacillus acidiphilus]|uniref:hypothetical protein n=1 Tax=Alicyclobacillus acidiphilus TaxID=182455 RepID=UPI00082E4777|nr:hypothetical protein [Alicyclobacillus acidiphilus]